jgi:xanthine dehydrogenase YagR molybdenum-binding subunit
VAAAAVVRLHAEDRAVVASATQEIGNGIYTLMTQVAADALKMPPLLTT